MTIEEEIHRVKEIVYEESAKLQRQISHLQLGMCLLLSQLKQRNVTYRYNDNFQGYEYGYYDEHDDNKFIKIS